MRDKKARKFFIQEHLLRGQLFHGGIGNVQIEEILLKAGYLPIHFPSEFDFSWKAKMRRTFYLFKILFLLPGDSTIVFQWPLHARLQVWLVKLLKQLRPSMHLICFLTDINGLRDNDSQLLQKEVKFFKKADSFIVHNLKMQEWLLRYHPEAKVAILEFFDFLADYNLGYRKKELSVSYAGNLDKARFVCQLESLPQIKFYLYGLPAISDNFKIGNVEYLGSVEPKLLPQFIKGAFGLVWDGDSLIDLQGAYGEYMRINSPHKVSLYVLAGLPIIAPHDAGVSSLITQYNIGFTVASMLEIKEAIDTISDEQYQKMRTNCLTLASIISKGGCLLNALAQLEIMRSSGQSVRNDAG
ncbi:MAG TPA: hypothetical protein VGN63_06960 [Flavisolibacter sp.]|nr:hypothetical protein [Flavisolibacter sp.]